MSTHPDEAFRAIHDANRQRILRLLTRIAGPEHAEDLTQTVFTKVALALPRFRGDADPSTWVYRIAVNTASDWLRSRALHERKMTEPLCTDTDENAAIPCPVVADPGPSPEQELIARGVHESLRRDIGRLPDAHREVLALSVLGALTDSEIAQALGLTLGNAKVRLHRAKRELKAIVGSRCDFYRTELSCTPQSPDCCAPSVAAADAAGAV